MTAIRWSALAAAFFISFAQAVGSACAQPVAGSASLTIHIDDVLPSGGIIRLGVYDEKRYPDDSSVPDASADVAATPGETTVTLHGIAPGIYAIQMFQDVNANGKMDMSWIGLPLEPFGFSRDAKPFLSKPSFDEVKFTVVAGNNVQVIHLQNAVTKSPADKARDAIRARQRQ